MDLHKLRKCAFLFLDRYDSYLDKTNHYSVEVGVFLENSLQPKNLPKSCHKIKLIHCHFVTILTNMT